MQKKIMLTTRQSRFHFEEISHGGFTHEKFPFLLQLWNFYC